MNQIKIDILSYFRTKKVEIFANSSEIFIPPVENNKEVDFRGQNLEEMILHAFSLTDNEQDVYIQKCAQLIAKIIKEQKLDITSYINDIIFWKNDVLYKISNDSLTKEELSLIYMQFTQTIDLFISYVFDFFIKKNTFNGFGDLYKKESHEERLTLLGQMTSSFVHEFRNPLTTVHGFIQLLRSEHPELPYLDIILSELDQLKFQISQFLMLSRKETVHQERSTFSFNDLINQISTFIYPRLLEFNVKLEKYLQEDLYINGHKEEIRQVIINIIFNAIDVLSEQETANLIKINGYRKEQSVFLEIANSGPKIPPQIAKTIFQPFVTTKKSGTGLGLYVSKEIIEKHHGHIHCNSDDNWTIFTIILPYSQEKAQNAMN